MRGNALCGLGCADGAPVTEPDGGVGRGPEHLSGGWRGLGCLAGRPGGGSSVVERRAKTYTSCAFASSIRPSTVFSDETDACPCRVSIISLSRAGSGVATP